MMYSMYRLIFLNVNFLHGNGAILDGKGFVFVSFRLKFSKSIEHRLKIYYYISKK